MISIIVCSIDSKQYCRFEDNIISTVGECEFELLRINNSSNTYTIAEAYNKGLKQAKYQFLLFIHEDIIIHTPNWGSILLKIFNDDENVGMIGIAGSRIKTQTPTAWWENTRDNLVMNLIQQYPNGKKERINFGFENKLITEVVCLDGVFIAMRNNIKIKFDERLKGFHNYDQAISMRLRENGYKIIVTNGILIEHFSIGNKNKEWIQSNLKFYDFYKTHLPQSIEGKKISRKETAYSNYRLMLNYKGIGDWLRFMYYFVRTIYFDPFKKNYYKEYYKILKKSFNE